MVHFVGAGCGEQGWRFRSFTAEELAAVPGGVTASGFVGKTAGADKACEQAAVLGSGGVFILRKFTKNGAAMLPDWRWRDE
ncbi:MAG: cobalamin biosynthesis protein [Lachnospiraceae bacterium]|nr:cobalamin biosynthesis protein [Lachnospiraceae bacterium]